MLTMRAAASLLAHARCSAALVDVARATGLCAAATPIDRATQELLGVPAIATSVHLARGPGDLRILVAELPGGSPVRETLQRMARSLAVHAPNVLWLVAVTQNGAASVIAGVERAGARGAIRIAAFSWEPDHVVDSDAETLCALSGIGVTEDVVLHARVVEVLGRDALTRRFYRALRTEVDGLAGSLPDSVAVDDARHVALLYASRLLFLAFLEAKGWLNGERAFVATRFDECMQRGGRFHHRVLLPLFFGTLNTPVSRRAASARAFGAIPFLNGGLFTRTAAERRAGRVRFPDERFGSMLSELFLRFRFVAREDSATWSEASVDPEMLGRAFESLMAAPDRRAGGVYYTPHGLVARVVDEALSALADSMAVREIRVLDPACGSGAFLVCVLERLAALRRDHGEADSPATIRRDVLARSIFGVDLDPTAVWLCELRLWLSVVIESEETDVRRVPPLPNLDRNIRVGDALSGPGFVADPVLLVGSARALDLRQRYLRATGRRKQQLARALDREERRRVLTQLDRSIDVARFARSELLASLSGRDLFGERVPRPADATRELRHLRENARRLRTERRRVADGGAMPFPFGAVFGDVQARGGFDVVLGNPPWVRLHRIPAPLRLHFKRLYSVYRRAHWEQGAAGARAAPGFASQVDLAALFAERALALLRPGGTTALLLPSKLWRSLAGGGVRRLFRQSATLRRLEDWSSARSVFDAAVYPSLIVAQSGQGPRMEPTIVVHDGRGAAHWTADWAGLAFDDTSGSPWILLPPAARVAFDLITRSGVPLSASCFGAPRLGVKSGCNAAFLVRVTGTSHELAVIADADGASATIEADLLRPALRGDAVGRWRRDRGDEWVVWTHDTSGAPLARLPAHASAWLRRRYSALTTRSDARRSRRWWSLFRVDAADATTARVVWSDFGRRPRALVLPPGDPAVPLNTCYVVRCTDVADAWALAALLNSPVAAAWLNAVAEPARGGYRRYLGWTVGLLPIPRDWARARELLAHAEGADDGTLTASVLRAYGLSSSELQPLLDMLR